LKTQQFKSENLLDMRFPATLRFVQKVLTVEPPLELFSLEEKAAQLPGGLFLCVKTRSEQNLQSLSNEIPLRMHSPVEQSGQSLQQFHS
jgi:hypothetical protein